jgi:N-acetylglucosaminyl-diphospho-decaprenol L-rhamnosyltransferase
MRILVVIVNFRTAALVVDCLRSLAGERASGHELRVAIVDNPGGDDSLAVLRQAIDQSGFAPWCELVAMPHNGGFAYGVNAGVQPALALPAPPDAFLLLNPDTWVRPGAIAALADFLAARPDIGMVGSRLEDADGTVQHSRFRFPCIANEFDHGLNLGIVSRWLRRHATCPPLVDEPHAIDWLSGACMLVRRSVFERVGPFDDGYFLYFEELDFARRAHGLGVTSWYVPASRVVHLVGRSTGVTVRDRRPPRTPAYWFASRRRYYGKHHARLYRFGADVAFVVGRALAHVLRVLRGRRYDGPPHYLRDFIRHNLWFGTPPR